MTQHLNLFQPRVTSYIETSHLLCSAKQMTGFYMKHNAGRKSVKELTKGKLTARNEFPN